MRATISKWGNSLAVRLPRHVADQVRLTEGTLVELEIEDGAIKVIPSRTKYSLAELLEGEPARGAKSASHEVDWGKPKGDEVW